MMKFSNFKTTFSKGVTVPSLIFIITVCVLSAVFPKLTEDLLNNVKEFIFVKLNWVYVWSVTIFVLFLIYLMFSKYGNIRLGRNDSKPKYSFFSWISMLFAAGMGIGLMYFSVAEPMQHYSNDVFTGNNHINRAKNAQLYTFFHWGIHAWAIYGVVGLALSYFAYRYRLPLSLRSCFYPLLKDKINGRWGNAIDVFALCSTFFGITTTLGFGVVQINSGLQTLHIVPENSFVYQVIIVSVLVTLSIISAVTGVDKGVKLLSNINVISVIVLLVFVLALGPTVYLIGSFTEGLGNYINNFFNLTFGTHVYEEETLPWFYNWTILYWAWWISWSPYVGLFIAKISKGRTIREFIAAVLILPTLFNFIWMSVFGNSAIWIDLHAAGGALSQLAGDPDALMFRFLEYMPFSSIVSFFVILIILIFFVTSADSGMFVMNSIATKNAKISPKWQTIFWGVLLAVLALLLLNAGGLKALQSMTLITALPFSIIIILFIVSLMKALIIDKNYYERDFSASTAPWSGEYWKERLKQIISLDDRQSIDHFINTTVKTAFTELQAEFAENGTEAKINTYENPTRIEIEIQYDLVNNFLYGVRNQSRTVSAYLLNEDNLPDADDNKAHFPGSYFGDAREGYDVRLFTKNELISDVLKHYERFIEIISEERNEMFISSNANKRMK
ncbi:BCCT family transporter [Elizabethkingia anophelis]|uniref:Transporter n=1 Tax=Elizabethkingia anophelis TaxID=1117645 RepID=A0A494JBG6_9FLAO|nr:BCCT family transporter [Elizabethkingia anophelis]AQX52239.1 transporter [Elizabethkingia anophelis]MCT3640853.1 BCCT family transporter [Elizabethkingia anophelis]MCT3905829.1 BCCT family transporter [Elizabethkingia anophelis]MCT4198149.1 BCCT family transporter [Elizabethkingia anophelis]MCT4226609.1 BCCT family transporter [Elizabethkingia anophelis]